MKTATLSTGLLDWRAEKPRRNEEAEIQAAIIQHLRLLAPPDVIFFAIPNGEHRSKRTGARLKAQGVLPGAPDLMFMLPDGSAACLEIKTKTGRQSPEQRAFEARCLNIGVPYQVVHSLDAALAVLRAWGAIREEVR